jgi:hypothetical protein
MQNTYRFAAGLAIAALAAGLGGLATPPSPAFACTPPPGGLVVSTVTTRTLAAPYVFAGAVITGTGSYGFIQSATVQVSLTVKGPVNPAQVVIDGFGIGADCKSVVTLGQSALFFARGDPANVMQANYLEAFSATAPLNEASLAEALAAANIRPRAWLPWSPWLPWSDRSVLSRR